MGNTYQGKSGTTYVIEEPALASGGEGSIHAIQGNKDLVLKVFKPDRRTHDREEKLLKMVEYQLDAEQLKQITWPQDVVYDKSGFVGYVMPRLLENRNLNVVYSTQGNKLDLRHRMLIAYNLCAAVDTVHSLNQVCGDLNPQNICVNLNLESESALRVTLVDTDSYHITDGNKTHRCEVGLANYLAPEIQKKMEKGQDLRSATLPTYTRETDLFALAVHIFALLMNGCHPFACAKQTNTGYENTMEAMDDKEQESVVLPQPIENIRDGFFPFRQQRSGVTYPLYAPDFNSLPSDIQHLFVRAFIDGYHNPSCRPTTGEWLAVLRKCQSPLQFAQCEKQHYYLNERSEKCPYCEASARVLQMLNGINTEIPNVQSDISASNNSNVQPGSFTWSGVQSNNRNTGNNNPNTNNIEEESYPKEALAVMLIAVAFIVWAISASRILATSSSVQPATTSIQSESTTQVQNWVDTEKEVSGAQYYSDDVFVSIDGVRFQIPCTYGDFQKQYSGWVEDEYGASYKLNGFEIYLFGKEEKIQTNEKLRGISIWLGGSEYLETIYGINSDMTVEEVQAVLKGVNGVEWYDTNTVNIICQKDEQTDIYVYIWFSEGIMYCVDVSYYDWAEY